MAFKLVFFQFLFGFAIGGGSQLYVSGFLLVSESIDSPRWPTRWWYRYCAVSFWFSISLLLVLAAYGALLKILKQEEIIRSHQSILVFTALLLALGFYFVDRRIKLYFNPRKLAAREALAAKARRRSER